jgi:hypothetical protein
VDKGITFSEVVLANVERLEMVRSTHIYISNGKCDDRRADGKSSRRNYSNRKVKNHGK